MWQSLLVYNACPQPQTEATVLVSPSLLQIDTFGKWCRCLHNVCYLKLKKRRYLDKCRLSAPAGISVSQFRYIENLKTVPSKETPVQYAEAEGSLQQIDIKILHLLHM